MNRHRFRGRARGFSLMEILVALVIASSSIGLLYNIQRNSQRAVVSAAEHTLAAELMRSLLAESLVYMNASINPITGTYADKYGWTMTFSPYDPPPGTQETDLLPLTEVGVAVKWRSGATDKQLHAKTLRPVSRPPEEQQ